MEPLDEMFLKLIMMIKVVTTASHEWLLKHFDSRLDEVEERNTLIELEMKRLRAYMLCLNEGGMECLDN